MSHSDINALIEGLDGAKSSSTKIRKMIDTFRSMSFEASTPIKSKSLSSKTVDPILISMLRRILDKSTQRAIVHVSINGGKFNDMSTIDQWLILKNLITNSFEASVDDKPAFIDIATFDSQFTLKDKGRGFVQEFLNLTKETFYSDKEGHLGMGLSIVDYLAKRQRARLEVSQADMTTIQILF
ncbi:MAG: sensor histidine kinase [Candidatus Heimdallarchaeota archaeon]|nr:sensor histidine kinase [Candidatus Heimdallarchaeota archaeon]